MKNLFIPLLACIACAVVVSFTAVSVRSTQELNLENDKKSKILLAAGINSENINEEFGTRHMLTTGMFRERPISLNRINKVNKVWFFSIFMKDSFFFLF